MARAESGGATSAEGAGMAVACGRSRAVRPGDDPDPQHRGQRVRAFANQCLRAGARRFPGPCRGERAMMARSSGSGLQRDAVGLMAVLFTSVTNMAPGAAVAFSILFAAPA